MGGRKQIPLARSDQGSLFYWDPTIVPHLLVSGFTGVGKSGALQSLAFHALCRGWGVCLSEPYKGGLSYRHLAPWMHAITGDIAESTNMVNRVYAEMIQRCDLIAQHDCDTIESLPEAQRPPRLLVLIDELESLIATDLPAPNAASALTAVLTPDTQQQQNVTSKIGQVFRRGWSVGIHLVLTTQGPTTGQLKGITFCSSLFYNTGVVELYRPRKPCGGTILTWGASEEQAAQFRKNHANANKDPFPECRAGRVGYMNLVREVTEPTQILFNQRGPQQQVEMIEGMIGGPNNVDKWDLTISTNV